MFHKYTVAALLACTVLDFASAGEVKIGVVTGITGPIAHTTAESLNITRGYLAMINAQGGINGNTLKLVARDDQYDPAKTGVLVEEAITQDNVVVILSSAGTANTAAILKTGILAKSKVPMVGVFSGAEILRGPGTEQIFHTRASYNDEVMKISRLVSTLGLKRVAVLYQDDGFGAGINESIAKAAQEFKFEVILKAPYKSGDTDFSGQARKIIDAHPQAIFLMGVPDAVNRFMKAYDAPVGSSQIYTLSYVSPKTLADFAGEARVRGIGISQVVPNPSSTVLPLAKEFQAFLKTPYPQGVKSSPLTFEMYMNLRLVIEAIRMAGPRPTGELVTQSLKTMHNYRLAGYPIDFTETNRRGSNYLDIAVVGQNGRLSY